MLAAVFLCVGSTEYKLFKYNIYVVFQYLKELNVLTEIKEMIVAEQKV